MKMNFVWVIELGVFQSLCILGILQSVWVIEMNIKDGRIKFEGNFVGGSKI